MDVSAAPSGESKLSNLANVHFTNDKTVSTQEPETTHEASCTSQAEDTNTHFTNSSPEPTPLSERVVRKRKVLRFVFCIKFINHASLILNIKYFK